MKFSIYAVCLVIVMTFATTHTITIDSGNFIPKAFYKLDAGGQMSELHLINPHDVNNLRRLRRQIFSSASSSSSAVSVDGGPIHFATQQIVRHSPELGSSSDALGDGAPLGVRTTGYFLNTKGHIDQNTGKVYYNTEKGRF